MIQPTKILKRLKAYRIETNFSLTDVYCWAESKKRALEMALLVTDSDGAPLYNLTYEEVDVCELMPTNLMRRVLYPNRDNGRGYMVVRLADLHNIADGKVVVPYHVYNTREEKIDALLVE